MRSWPFRPRPSKSFPEQPQHQDEHQYPRGVATGVRSPVAVTVLPSPPPWEAYMDAGDGGQPPLPQPPAETAVSVDFVENTNRYHAQPTPYPA